MMDRIKTTNHLYKTYLLFFMSDMSNTHVILDNEGSLVSQKVFRDIVWYSERTNFSRITNGDVNPLLLTLKNRSGCSQDDLDREGYGTRGSCDHEEDKDLILRDGRRG